MTADKGTYDRLASDAVGPLRGDHQEAHKAAEADMAYQSRLHQSSEEIGDGGCSQLGLLGRVETKSNEGLTILVLLIRYKVHIVFLQMTGLSVRILLRCRAPSASRHSGAFGFGYVTGRAPFFLSTILSLSPYLLEIPESVLLSQWLLDFLSRASRVSAW